MSNQYKDVIQSLRALTADDALDIVFKVAASNPSAINKVVSMKDEPSNNAHKKEYLVSMVEDLVSACASGKKIAAIKAIRQITGLGLKEAKDITDKHWNPYNPF